MELKQSTQNSRNALKIAKASFLFLTNSRLFAYVATLATHSHNPPEVSAYWLTLIFVCMWGGGGGGGRVRKKDVL